MVYDPINGVSMRRGIWEMSNFARLQELTDDMQDLQREREAARARLADATTQTLRSNASFVLRSGFGMPFDPTNFTSFLASGLNISRNYQDLSYQASSMFTAGKDQSKFKGQFNDLRQEIERLGDAFSSIGKTQSEAIQSMMTFASAASTATDNVKGLMTATRERMEFSKAFGVEQSVVDMAAGRAVMQTGMSLPASTRFINRAMAATDGRFNNFGQVADAALGIMSQQNFAGFTGGERQSSVALQFVDAMKQLNPDLYGANPGLAVQRSAELQSLGNGVLMPFAFRAAAELGLPTDPMRVRAALETDPRMQAKIADYMRNEGVAQVAAMSGATPANVALGFRNNRRGMMASFGVDADGNPVVGSVRQSDTAIRAWLATTNLQRGNARLTTDLEGSKTLEGTLNLMGTLTEDAGALGTVIGGQIIGGGISMLTPKALTAGGNRLAVGRDYFSNAFSSGNLTASAKGAAGSGATKVVAGLGGVAAAAAAMGLGAYGAMKLVPEGVSDNLDQFRQFAQKSPAEALAHAIQKEMGAGFHVVVDTEQSKARIFDAAGKDVTETAPGLEALRSGLVAVGAQGVHNENTKDGVAVAEAIDTANATNGALTTAINKLTDVLSQMQSNMDGVGLNSPWFGRRTNPRSP